ncbi:response regulator SirA [bacterium]|nr:response regulator SirA [bacterium]
METHITHIYKRNGQLVKFDQKRVTDAMFRAAASIGGKDVDRARELTDIVVGIMNGQYEKGQYPTVEETQDIIINVLQREGHMRTARAYAAYRQEHSRLRRKRETGEVPDTVPYKLLWEVVNWNVDYGCDTIYHLNEHIRRGTFPILVREAERVYQREIDKLAREIEERLDDVKIVIVAGPSSSGKTTTTIRLGEKLAHKNVEFVTIGLDNYFYDLETHPKDEFGDYDFERPEALDIPLVNEHLAALIEGKEVMMPYYNFKTGKREPENAKPFKLAKNQILIVDSLHGLYEPLTASVPADRIFRMYIEAMCQIKDNNMEFVRWADLRMLRRMVRDSWARAYSPNQTVGHWHYVRRSELQYIVPYLHTADFVFNGSLPYELPVLKRHLWKYMDEIHSTYENEPKRYDASIRARRVHRLLDSITQCDNEECIPEYSLMREYIGGSCYKY